MTIHAAKGLSSQQYLLLAWRRESFLMQIMRPRLLFARRRARRLAYVGAITRAQNACIDVCNDEKNSTVPFSKSCIAFVVDSQSTLKLSVLFRGLFWCWLGKVETVMAPLPGRGL